MFRSITTTFILLILAVITACSPAQTLSQGSQSPPEIKLPNLDAFIAELRADPIFIHSVAGLLHGQESEDVHLQQVLLHTCHQRALVAFYRDRAWRTHFARKYASAILAVLEETPTHGLPPSPYLADAKKYNTQLMTLVRNRPDIALNAQHWQRLKDVLFHTQFDYRAPNARDRLLYQIAQEPNRYFPNLADKISDYDNELNQSLVALESQLACGIAEWALQMRLAYPDNDYKLQAWWQPLAPWLGANDLVQTRLAAFLQDLAENGVAAARAAILPPHPQYEKLRRARSLYAEAVAQGDSWPEVNLAGRKKSPILNRSYAFIPAVRQRLIAEGYDPGPADSDVYDEQVQKAVVAYREAHQLSTKNTIDATLGRNFAVKPSVRLASIDLTLQRMRESAVGSLANYIYVNIPDFHAEVWHAGERQMRFRVVVGKNNMQRDPVTRKPVRDPRTKEIIYPNRTPLLEAVLRYIVYNPYWNVPERIRQEELAPHLTENPSWYIENGYEEVDVDNPRLYRVRRLPGPKNDLGRVKFIFPNPHNVYLHDTPHKGVFRNPTRAYSHGCMRVQNPLDLAETLLTNDGQYDAAEVRSILRTQPYEESTFVLKKSVPITISYFDTRVDAAGHVHFLSDVYGYDAARLAEK